PPQRSAVVARRRLPDHAGWHVRLPRDGVPPSLRFDDVAAGTASRRHAAPRAAADVVAVGDVVVRPTVPLDAVPPRRVGPDTDGEARGAPRPGALQHLVPNRHDARFGGFAGSRRRNERQPGRLEGLAPHARLATVLAYGGLIPVRRVGRLRSAA